MSKLIEAKKIISIISHNGEIIGLDEDGNIWEYFADHDDWYAIAKSKSGDTK